jgi:hypothetical protein
MEGNEPGAGGPRRPPAWRAPYASGCPPAACPSLLHRHRCPCHPCPCACGSRARSPPAASTPVAGPTLPGTVPASVTSCPLQNTALTHKQPPTLHRLEISQAVSPFKAALQLKLRFHYLCMSWDHDVAGTMNHLGKALLLSALQGAGGRNCLGRSSIPGSTPADLTLLRTSPSIRHAYSPQRTFFVTNWTIWSKRSATLMARRALSAQWGSSRMRMSRMYSRPTS